MCGKKIYLDFLSRLRARTIFSARGQGDMKCQHVYNSLKKKYQIFRKKYHTLIIRAYMREEICIFDTFLLILHRFSALCKRKTFEQS